MDENGAKRVGYGCRARVVGSKCAPAMDPKFTEKHYIFHYTYQFEYMMDGV